MPDGDKKSFKEKRQERQQGRVDKLTKERKAEAKQAGVDLDKPMDIGPLGSERKERIDQVMREGVKGDMREGLQKIQSLRTAPETKVSELPKAKYDIEDVRAERRAKIADILNTFGSTIGGESVSPTMYRDRLKGERLAQYEQYKGTSQAAKQRLREWENAYIDEQLDYLNQKLDDPKITDLEKNQIEKSKIQLEQEKVRLATSQENLRQLKSKGKDKEEPEVPTAKLVRDIDEHTRTTRDIPIEEAKEREQQAAIKEATQEIDIELNQAKLDLANMGEEGTKRREIFDRPKRDNLVAKISALEAQKQEILDSFSAFDDIINKHK